MSEDATEMRTLREKLEAVLQSIARLETRLEERDVAYQRAIADRGRGISVIVAVIGMASSLLTWGLTMLLGGKRG